jgi:hypothetical protein
MKMKMKSIFTQMTTYVMLLTLLLSSVVQTAAYAAEPYSGAGAGTPEDPYMIKTANQLNEVRNQPGASYMLAANIDLGGSSYSGNWTPIGNEASPFTGSFSGEGYTITGLRINSIESNDVGLFGYTGSAAVIQDLNLHTVEITTHVEFGDQAGALVGHNQGQISNVKVINSHIQGKDAVGAIAGLNEGAITGSQVIEGQVNGNDHIGGLIGRNTVTGTVYLSQVYELDVLGHHQVGGLTGANYGDIHKSNYTSGEEGKVSGTGSSIGGLAGFNYAEGTISYSYAQGDVGASTTQGNEVGGFVGRNEGVISSSYAKVGVQGLMNVGGLIGAYDGGAINQSYSSGAVQAGNGNSTRGGFIGYATSMPAITDSFWDRETTGDMGSGVGNLEELHGDVTLTGLISPALQKKVTYEAANWDFVQTWDIVEDSSTPTLLSRLNHIQVSTDGTVWPLYFSPHQYEYTVHVPAGVQVVQIGVTKAKVSDTVHVANGWADDTYEEAELVEDTTFIPVRTIRAGATPEEVTYTIKVVRQPQLSAITTIPYAGMQNVPLILQIPLPTGIQAYDPATNSGDVLKVEFPAGYILPGADNFKEWNIHVASDNDQEIYPYIVHLSLAPGFPAAERWLQIGLDEGLPEGSTLYITFESTIGIGNPTTAGTYNFGVGINSLPGTLYPVMITTASGVADVSIETTDNLVTFYGQEAKSNYTFYLRPTTALQEYDQIVIRIPDGYTNNEIYFNKYWDETRAIDEEELSVYNNGTLLEISSSSPGRDTFGSSTISITLGEGAIVGTNDLIKIQLNDYLWNPYYYGNQLFQISTSKDKMPIEFEIPVIDTKVALLEVLPDSRIEGEIGVGYTIRFKSMAPIAEDDVIRLEFPPGVIPIGMGQAALENLSNIRVDFENVSDIEIDTSAAPSFIEINPTQDIPSLTSVTVSISPNIGLVNPEQGYHSYGISSTADSERATVDSVYFHSIEGSSVDWFSADTSYDEGTGAPLLRLYFETHLPLHDDGDFVEFIFPEGIDISKLDVSHIHFFTNEEVNFEASQAEWIDRALRIYIPVGARIAAKGGAQFFLPMEDEIPPGTYTFTMSTSQEMLEAVTDLEMIPDRVQNLSVIPENLVAGKASGYTFNFKTHEELSAEMSITIEFPMVVTPPTDPGEPSTVTMNGVPMSYELDEDLHRLELFVPGGVEVDILENVEIIFSEAFGLVNPSTVGEAQFGVKIGRPYDEYYTAVTTVTFVHEKDLTALSLAIAAAKEVKLAAIVGTAAGQYSQEAVEILRAAIEAAEGVEASSGATQAEVDEAVITLVEAVVLFKSQAIGTTLILAHVERVGVQSELILTFKDKIHSLTNGSSPAGFALTNTNVGITGAYLDAHDHHKVHLSLSGDILSSAEVKVIVQADAIRIGDGKLNTQLSALHVILAADVDQLRQELLLGAPSTGGKIGITHVVSYLRNQFKVANKYDISDEAYLGFILQLIDPVAVSPLIH